VHHRSRHQAALDQLGSQLDHAGLDAFLPARQASLILAGEVVFGVPWAAFGDAPATLASALIV
jgi:hypothetical protein